MENIYRILADMEADRTAGALCIVVSTRGSTPRKTGARMIVRSDGSVIGTIGGGSIELEVTRIALERIRMGAPPELCTFRLEEDLAMHCGGEMAVYIEPLALPADLVIFGAGHIGKALARYARDFGFAVSLVDPREEVREPALTGVRWIPGGWLEAVENIRFHERVFVVIVTPKHILDEEILAAVAHRPHLYLGLIGSSRKVAALKERFLSEKLLTEEELERVDMPIGIPFRAETPAEIAISILARLIDVKNSL